jgi:hypothetical protein
MAHFADKLDWQKTVDRVESAVLLSFIGSGLALGAAVYDIGRRFRSGRRTEAKTAPPKRQIALDEIAELVWQCEFPDDIASKLVEKMQEFPQSSFRHLGKHSPAFLTLWNAIERALDTWEINRPPEPL